MLNEYNETIELSEEYNNLLKKYNELKKNSIIWFNVGKRRC